MLHEQAMAGKHKHTSITMTLSSHDAFRCENSSNHECYRACVELAPQGMQGGPVLRAD